MTYLSELFSSKPTWSDPTWDIPTPCSHLLRSDAIIALNTLWSLIGGSVISQKPDLLSFLAFINFFPVIQPQCYSRLGKITQVATTDIIKRS